MKNVLIIGASGHGKVIADIVQKVGDNVIGFLDDNKALAKTFVRFPLLGTVCDYKDYINRAEFLVAIGNAEVRERIVKEMNGVKWYTAIHPSVVISDIDVSIGEGTVVMANAVINSGSRIGRHCIINSCAVVEHDNIIEDFVHVSVGSKLGGTVHIGKATWVGIGTSINNNVNICERCMTGAGSVVIKDINEPGTYIGVPAKRIEKVRSREMFGKYSGGG